MDEDSIQTFHADGFLTWQSFLTRSHLDRFRTNVDNILLSLHPNCDPEWIQHVHQLPEGKWLLDLASSLKPIASSLLDDPSPTLYSSQIAVRNPGTNETTPWHQDGPGAGVITFWIALDRVDEKNGGLQVVPRGHIQGRLQLRKLESEAELPLATKMASHNVFECCVKARDIFKYRLRAGGAGVHHDSLPHCAGPNTTCRPRRVIILRYVHNEKQIKSGKFLHHIHGIYMTRKYVELT
jgi:hypothetical protein